MREEKNVFVIDRLENIGKYAGLNANFAKAVAFLATGDFAALAPGKSALDGENAFDIAKRCNTTVEDIMKRNEIKTPFDIKAGERLVI